MRLLPQTQVSPPRLIALGEAYQPVDFSGMMGEIGYLLFLLQICKLSEPLMFLITWAQLLASGRKSGFFKIAPAIYLRSVLNFHVLCLSPIDCQLDRI